MQLSLEIRKRTFHFAFDARTSRGPMRDRTSWFIFLSDTEKEITGVGEVAPIFGLSKEEQAQIESDLSKVTEWINHYKNYNLPTDLLQINIEIDALHLCSSVKFGIEMAILDFVHGGRRTIFNEDFQKGKQIPINGLVWMADAETMLAQAESKIQQGFKCIKLKVGSLDFGVEVDLIKAIRRKYPSDKLQIRLDANGAFSSDEALSKLTELSRFDIHSIEQPVAAGNLSLTKDLCNNSPIPIALDEELIGIDTVSKPDFLGSVMPAYLVLKPSLHGGFYNTAGWIKAAADLNIGWWITSSLESVYGLNAICQFLAQYSPLIPQGLGTGSIFTNGPKSPLKVQNGLIFYDFKLEWEKP